MSPGNGPPTLVARESKSVNRNIGGKKKLDPLSNALALEPLNGNAYQKVPKMNQDDPSYPETENNAREEMRPSDKIEDLSDYEEALS